MQFNLTRPDVSNLMLTVLNSPDVFALIALLSVWILTENFNFNIWISDVKS